MEHIGHTSSPIRFTPCAKRNKKDLGHRRTTSGGWVRSVAPPPATAPVRWVGSVKISTTSQNTRTTVEYITQTNSMLQLPSHNGNPAGVHTTMYLLRNYQQLAESHWACSLQHVIEARSLILLGHSQPKLTQSWTMINSSQRFTVTAPNLGQEAYLS